MKAAAIVYVFALGTGVVSSPGQASIEGSKHDFRNRASESAAGGTSKEICAFCHTPIGGETAPAAPLWNPRTLERAYERPASFGTSNLDENAVGPVSLTCLSCHDGTQGPDASYVGRLPWDSDTARDSEDGTATREAPPAGQITSFLSGHPVNVSYAGGACIGIETDCDPTIPGRDADFRIAQFDVINSMKSWWVDSAEGAPGMRDKSDMILYPRDFGGSVGPAVECGSCHDPHDGRQRPVSFLRMPAAGGSLCLTCHIK